MSKTIINAEKLRLIISYLMANGGENNTHNQKMIDEAFPQVEEKKWYPLKNETVWYFRADGEIARVQYNYQFVGDLSQHRIFKTEAEAQAFKNKYEEWIKTV